MCLSDHFEWISTGFTWIFGESFFYYYQSYRPLQNLQKWSEFYFLFQEEHCILFDIKIILKIVIRTHVILITVNCVDGMCARPIDVINVDKIQFWYEKTGFFFCFHFILSIGTQIDHICALNVHVCLNGISSIWIIDSILKWKKNKQTKTF